MAHGDYREDFYEDPIKYSHLVKFIFIKKGKCLFLGWIILLLNFLGCLKH